MQRLGSYFVILNYFPPASFSFQQHFFFLVRRNCGAVATNRNCSHSHLQNYIYFLQNYVLLHHYSVGQLFSHLFLLVQNIIHPGISYKIEGRCWVWSLIPDSRVSLKIGLGGWIMHCWSLAGSLCLCWHESNPYNTGHSSTNGQRDIFQQRWVLK